MRDLLMMIILGCVAKAVLPTIIDSLKELVQILLSM